NVKSRRNNNKKDSNPNGRVNESLESKNNDQAEEMDDSQIGAFGETVVEGMNESVNNLVSKEVGRTGMVDEMDNSVGGKEANSQKDNVEGIKFSYANVVNNSNLDNKLNLIPTEVNDDGIELDPSVSLDKAEPCKLPLWVKLRNLPLEDWSSKRISVVASRLGTPLIMDQITTNMCNLGNGRPGFARVLVDVEAGKGLPKKIDILYKNKEGVVTGNKSVNVSYDWAPPMCTCCKVFGHNDKNYGSRPRTVDEFMEEERNDLKQKQVNADFVQVQHRKKGAKKVNVRDGNKKDTKGIKSNNVMYKPVEKGNSKAGEQNKPCGGSNAKRKNNSVSQNQARNKNKFDVLREYDRNEIQENEVEEIEEDDVFECSGMANSMKENEVIGLDSNVLQECC
ncbi:RNA-directed DNA polymerase, eukaryota, reverse transcriptase zinc-binding domain protein, partial [Tanacetum coccineum]